MLEPGDPAPDFDLPGTDGDQLGLYRLSEALRDGPAVLFFYPFDFHPRCTEDICTMRDFEWLEFDPAVTTFGIGPDSAYSHRGYARHHDVGFALLSDPGGRVADLYDVPRETVDHHAGVPVRTVFVVDEDATVEYAWTADGPDDVPDLEAVADAVCDGS